MARAAQDEVLPTGIRLLRDDTLVVVMSDTHLGGDEGRDIFESPGELARLLDELTAQEAPVHLVLAGDLFDFLRIGHVPPGENRASLTISRPEYRDLFAALRRFGAAHGSRVVYLPGNHDAESWWNPDVQSTLLGEGLVHEIALSYAARFASAPACTVYCEHGHPNVQTLLSEIAWDAALLVAVFVVFLFVVQRSAAQTMVPLSSGIFRAGGTRSSVEHIQDLLVSGRHPPMHGDLPGREIGVLVSGHTHAPALTRLSRGTQGDALIANSGCWLRQLRPVPAHFSAPPVFVPTFVHTHVRVRLDGSTVRVELWDRPRPAPVRLRVTERIAVTGRLSVQPVANAPSRLVAADGLAAQEAVPTDA